MKYLAGIFQKFQGHERKNEKLSQIRGDKGDMTVNTIWDPGLDLGREGKICENTDEIRRSSS